MPPPSPHLTHGPVAPPPPPSACAGPVRAQRLADCHPRKPKHQPGLGPHGRRACTRQHAGVQPLIRPLGGLHVRPLPARHPCAVARLPRPAGEPGPAHDQPGHAGRNKAVHALDDACRHCGRLEGWWAGLHGCWAGLGSRGRAGWLGYCQHVPYMVSLVVVGALGGPALFSFFPRLPRAPHDF